jgi:hypothetical protein
MTIVLIGAGAGLLLLALLALLVWDYSRNPRSWNG